MLLAFCSAGVSFVQKKLPVHPVNLSTAGSAELQMVPGIGPSTADKILQMRKSYGAFKSVDDLLAIKGIGQKRLEKMREYLVVRKTPQSKKATEPAAVAGEGAACEECGGEGGAGTEGNCGARGERERRALGVFGCQFSVFSKPREEDWWLWIVGVHP
jgi:competence ComEA-like helix-hairpin-helix protein